MGGGELAEQAAVEASGPGAHDAVGTGGEQDGGGRVGGSRPEEEQLLDGRAEAARVRRPRRHLHHVPAVRVATHARRHVDTGVTALHVVWRRVEGAARDPGAGGATWAPAPRPAALLRIQGHPFLRVPLHETADKRVGKLDILNTVREQQLRCLQRPHEDATVVGGRGEHVGRVEVHGEDVVTVGRRQRPAGGRGAGQVAAARLDVEVVHRHLVVPSGGDDVTVEAGEWRHALRRLPAELAHALPVAEVPHAHVPVAGPGDEQPQTGVERHRRDAGRQLDAEPAAAFGVRRHVELHHADPGRQRPHVDVRLVVAAHHLAVQRVVERAAHRVLVRDEPVARAVLGVQLQHEDDRRGEQQAAPVRVVRRADDGPAAHVRHVHVVHELRARQRVEVVHAHVLVARHADDVFAPRVDVDDDDVALVSVQDADGPRRHVRVPDAQQRVHTARHDQVGAVAVVERQHALVHLEDVVRRLADSVADEDGRRRVPADGDGAVEAGRVADLEDDVPVHVSQAVAAQQRRLAADDRRQKDQVLHVLGAARVDRRHHGARFEHDDEHAAVAVAPHEARLALKIKDNNFI